MAKRPDFQLLRIAERNATRLDREHSAFATALALSIRAVSSHLRGDSARALSLLAQSAAEMDAIDRGLSAACTRRILGKLLAGDEGTSLVRAADAWMEQRGVRNPQRMAAFFTGLFLD